MKSHMEKFLSFYHFGNISTNSERPAIDFFSTGLISPYIVINIKIQKSTKRPIFLMIFGAKK